MATYIIENGDKRLQLDDGSKADVVVPLSLDEGTNVKLIAAQETILSNIETDVDNLWGVQGTSFSQLQTADDLEIDYTYLDAGGADERIQTITYTSSALGVTVTETFTYAGSPGSYRVTNITRS